MNLDYLFFTLAVAVNAYREHLVFHRGHDDGYFSLHTLDTFDAWHHSGLLFWVLIIAGFTFGDVLDKLYVEIIAYLLINFFVHEFLLHFVFKMWDGNLLEACIETYFRKWKIRFETVWGLVKELFL